MEVIIKPNSKKLDKYIKKGISDFLLPLKDFSVEYLNYYTLEEIELFIKTHKNINIFVSINKNIFNKDLQKLEEIMIKLDKLKVKGIFYYDLALLSIKRKLNLTIDLVWNQTHMVTNYNTCNYYYNLGVKYALMSKEITTKEIVEIKKKSKIIPIVELISYPSVAFSKRSLVTNYYKDIKTPKKDSIDILEKVSGDKYLVYEDKNGTTFIKEKITNGFMVIDELLDNGIEYVLLKEDLIEERIFLDIIKDLNYYINNYKNMSEKQKKEFIEKEEKILGTETLFFDKELIYKVK